MWKINANDVRNIGRTSGGDKFTEFIDAIIYAHAAACNIPASDVKTTLRVNWTLPRLMDTELSQCRLLFFKSHG